jgi:REP element-mobilizing transposase RayT
MPFLPADARREEIQRAKMRQPEYRLDEGRRQVVLESIRQVARHRGWTLWAVHVRTNHVHVVVSAQAKPEKIMIDLKAWSSRRLREKFQESADRDRWTQHGSTLYLWTEAQVIEKIDYVLNGQGEPMSSYDGRDAPPATAPSEPEA